MTGTGKPAWLDWRLVLSIIVSLAVVLLVVMELDLAELRRTLARASIPWLLVALTTHVLNYLLRALRFQKLLPAQKINYVQLFSISSLYGMLLYLMPAKSGEVSLPAILKLRQGVSISESAAMLVVARFYDLVSVALFLPFVLLAFRQQMPDLMFYTALAFVVLMMPVGIGYFFWLRRRADKPLPTRSEAGTGWVGRVRRWLHRVMINLHLLASMKGQGWLLLNTVAIWLCVYSNFYFVAAALGYRLGFGHVVVLSILMIPLTLFPVQGVANVGSHEVGWVGAFAIFGYSQDQALVVAVGSHAILFLEVLILGAIGWLLGLTAGRPKDVAVKRGEVGKW